MNAFTGFIVYAMIFWTVLFAVLPWGNRAPDELEEGMAGGAPANPRIKQKFLMTAGVSAVLWVIVAILIHHGIIDFHAIARHMTEEDLAL